VARTSGAQTRAALLRAAERLMAAHGIEGASLNDIVTLAGQRNRSAVLFHFGGRDQLVDAIVLDHRRGINAERNRMLDAFEADGRRGGLRKLVEALVLPLADSLSSRSGRDYIVILAERAARGGTAAFISPDGLELDSISRCNRLIWSLVGGNDAERRLRIAEVELTGPVLLADIARDIERGSLASADVAGRVGSMMELMAAGLASLAPRPASAD